MSYLKKNYRSRSKDAPQRPEPDSLPESFVFQPSPVPETLPAQSSPIPETLPAQSSPIPETLPERSSPIPAHPSHMPETLPEQPSPIAQQQTLEGHTVKQIGRYQIRKKLGQGGMGVVYLVHDAVLKREMALKTVTSTDDPDAVKRFMKEATTMAKLNHPNIVKIYDVGNEGGVPYFTMDFIEGKSLSDLTKEERMTVRRAIEITRKTANAIDYAHKTGILHRDIKPANIMLNPEDEPIVMDFGLAKETQGGNASVSKTGTAVGTPAYMSPEQAWGKRKETDERSDVYSIGAVLYELLTGRPPFHGSAHSILLQVSEKDPIRPTQISSLIPKEVENICLKAMSKEKMHRYQSAQEMAKDLERFLHGEPVLAMPQGWKYKAGKWVTRNRALAWSASFILVLAVLTFLVSYYQIRQERDKAKKAELEAKKAELEAKRNWTLSQISIADKKWCEGDTYRAEVIYAAIILREKKENLPPDIIRLARFRLAHSFSGLSYCRGILEGHKDRILAVAVSPDGKTIASGDEGGLIYLWDAHQEKIVSVLQGHSNYVLSLSFSPDGNTLASGSEDRTIRLWNLEARTTRAVLSGHEKPVYSVCFDKIGNILASGSGDGTIRLWDVRSATLKNTLHGHTHWIRTVVFSPDGKTLASGSHDQTVRLWDVATSRNKAILYGHNHWVFNLAFAPDGETLASCSYDRSVRLWNTKDQSVKAIFWHRDRIQSLSFSPDGKILACAGMDTEISLWDVIARTKKGYLYGHKMITTSLSFGMDSNTLFSGGYDKQVRIWNISSDLQRVLKEHNAPVTCLAFSPDGTTLASGSRDSRIVFWNWKTGQYRESLQIKNWVHSIAYSPDRKMLAWITISQPGKEYRNIVYTWNITDGKSEIKMSGESGGGGTETLAFSPDSRYLATGIETNTVVVLDIKTSEIIRLTGHSKLVTSAAFSPDGKILASGSCDKTIILWDVASFTKKAVLHAHIQEITTLAFSPDGKILASGSNDNTIRLWNTTDWSLKTSLEGHIDKVRSLAFSPDSKVLASASWDTTIRLWDVNMGLAQAIFKMDFTMANSVVFSPDGKFLASGNQDNLIRIWSLLRNPEFLDLPAQSIKEMVEKRTGLSCDNVSMEW